MGTGVIPPSDTVRNLGIILDSNLSMDRHISAVSRAAFMSLRNIGMVRKHINDHVAELLSHAYITSRLDMGNSALYKLNKSQLNRLQRLQNNAARVVTLSKKSVSISSLLKQLPWLPIEQRIKYKISLLVFKAMNGHSRLIYVILCSHMFQHEKIYALQTNFSLKNTGHATLGESVRF